MSTHNMFYAEIQKYPYFKVEKSDLSGAMHVL